MSHFWKTALLGTALIAPMAIAPTASRAADRPRTYHDNAHNDDHEWNAHENKAYGMWVKENHRKNTNFAKLKVTDQQAYWGWRHEHSDALLNINIR